MPRLYKVIALAFTFVLMLGLSACAVPDKAPTDISEFSVTLADGTEVPCFKIRGYDGYECNFDKAVRSNKPSP